MTPRTTTPAPTEPPPGAPSAGSRSAHRPPTPSAAVSLRGVDRVYRAAGAAAEIWALRDVDVDLMRGEMTAIMGPSGSGKTTLLHCAAGLDRPTSGSVHLGDTELSALSERKLTELRRRRLGFVFQAYNLVPSLTVTENLELPFRLSDVRPDLDAIAALLARVGLTEHAGHLPSELSGGQQQRAAIARAVVTRPDVVLADEPTGALDQASGQAVLDLLGEVVREAGQTVVLVTHDPKVAAAADRVVLLRDGEVDVDLREPSVEVLADHLAGRHATAAGVRRAGS